MTVSISPTAVQDIERVQKKLAALPPAAISAGDIQATNYLLSVLINKEVPPYKYIPRSQVPWKSDKQRRYVMMMVRKGVISVPYQRQGKSTDYSTAGQVNGAGVQGSWLLAINKNTNQATITNKKPYAYWLYGQQQSRRHALIGWKKMSAILAEYEKRIYESFMRGVRKAIRDLNLQ